MSALVYLQLTYSYMLWMTYMTLNFTYLLIRHLYWRTKGFHMRFEENKRQENYSSCAHVQKVLFRYRIDGFMEARKSDFVLKHDTFVAADYVLRDDVHLYTVTTDEAVFIQTRKDCSKALYKEEVLIIAQFENADRVISMPLNQFNKLAESVEDDGAKIVLLHNQSRCGGTLLTNIFKESGRCITYNEPHVYQAICKHIFNDNIWHGAKARQMFRNTIRMMCKPYKGLDGEGGVLAHVIKPTVLNAISIPMVQDVFPNAAQFFMYRDPVPIAISLRRIGEVLDTLKLMFYLPSIPNTSAFSIRFIGCVSVDFRGWTPVQGPELEFGYRIACLSMFHYQEARKHGVKIQGIRYSDLCAYKDKMIARIFTESDLPLSLIDKAKQALTKDSQSTTPISRENLQKAMPNPPKATPEFLEIARDLAKEFGVPGPDGWDDKSFRLPGSLIVE